MTLCCMRIPDVVLARWLDRKAAAVRGACVSAERGNAAAWLGDAAFGSVS